MGEWIVGERVGRVDWRWWIRDLWVMSDCSVEVEMNIGGVTAAEAEAAGLSWSSLVVMEKSV